jgi:hypothetical protein
VAYQLDVVTASVAEAVRYVGGPMFDRSCAGWRVRVVTEDTAHRRALAILGTDTPAPEVHNDSLHNPNRVVRSLLVPIEQFTKDSQTHAVQDTKLEPPAEVLVWGQHVNSGSTDLVHPVRHELSAAARTFKAEALRCAALDTRVDCWEEFWAAKILDPAPFGHLLLNPQGLHALGAPEPTANNRARSPSVVGGFPRG